MIDLTGKRLLITGASSGIGKQTAILASQLGAKVVLVARREPELKDVLRQLHGDDHVYRCFDLQEIDEIDGFIQATVESFGPLDGLVHAAGVGGSRPLKMLTPSRLDQVMRLNFYSFVELIRSVTKRNRFNAGMSIVGISSVASVQGNQGKLAYCASKAALDAAVRCLAKELHRKKIRVNSVLPGLIETEMYDQFLNVGKDSSDAELVIARQYAGVGKPEDVANMIMYLLSDVAKFVTGTGIHLDGGRLSS